MSKPKIDPQFKPTYSPRNPKLDIYDNVTGVYIASSNWYPSIAQFNAYTRERNPNYSARRAEK